MHCGTILATAAWPTVGLVGYAASRQANGNMLANNTVSQSSEVAFRAHVELIKPRRSSERAASEQHSRVAKVSKGLGWYDVATRCGFASAPAATSGSKCAYCRTISSNTALNVYGS